MGRYTLTQTLCLLLVAHRCLGFTIDYRKCKCWKRQRNKLYGGGRVVPLEGRDKNENNIPINVGKNAAKTRDNDLDTITPTFPGTSMKHNFLIHNGRSVDMIRRSPSLAGVTLCKGWSPTATEAFHTAVRSVVELNPILSGHVYDMKRNFFNSGELWIQTGTYDPEWHNFVQCIDPPAHTPDFVTIDPTEAVSYCLKEIYPLLDECELTEKQIKDKLPLFSATLIVLPNQCALYTLKMSHCIGDGVTFFQLVKQISMLMSGIDITPIEWNNPLKPTHEFYPESFSPLDIEISYGLPFFLGLLKNFPSLSKRRRNIILISKHRVSARKRELRAASGSKTLSSNDVIIAALCEANKSSDIFVFTQNVRCIKDGVPRHTGGNFFREVPLSRKPCCDPQHVRDCVSNVGFCKANELPIQPFVCGRVGRLTSLASITEKVHYEGTEIVFQLPYLSFIKELPLDVAVIFRFNDSYWGVLHNFAEYEISGSFLEEISTRVD